MKKFLLTLAVLLSFAIAQADSYSYLVFQTTDGTTTAVNVSNMSITISGTTLTATNSSSTYTFTLSNLSKMYFSNTSTTSLSQVTEADTSGELYNLAGQNIGRFSDLQTITPSLQQGTYVVKQKGQTFKITIQ